MSGEEYEFRIDKFTPSTIPMARLAEYLRELAALIGHYDSVHFKRIKGGSVSVVASVESEAIPKVRARLQSARDPEAPKDIRKPFERIDEMLREDNAIAKINRGNSNVVKFLGRDGARNPRMGPFSERGEIDGKIVRVGGADKTAHVLIEQADGEILSAEISRELAVALAHYLYTKPVRLAGLARWERTETGQWNLVSFRAKEFELLKDDDLASAVGNLRRIEADWKHDPDPLALLERVRGSSGEA
jgi:hypothetical protein